MRVLFPNLSSIILHSNQQNIPIKTDSHIKISNFGLLLRFCTSLHPKLKFFYNFTSLIKKNLKTPKKFADTKWNPGS